MKNIFRIIVCLLISSSSFYSYAGNSDQIRENVNNRINVSLGDLMTAFLAEGSQDDRTLIFYDIIEYTVLLRDLGGGNSISSVVDKASLEIKKLEQQGIKPDPSLIFAIKYIEKKYNFKCNSRDCFAKTPYRINIK